MNLLLVCVICISSLCGCVTTVINRTDPYEIKLQDARFEYEKQERMDNKIAKKRLAGYNRILKLRANRLKEKELLKLPKLERDLILLAFKDSGIILKAFEKLGCSVFDIAGFLNEYGKTDIDGFCDFLAEKYPFTQWFRWALDRDVFNPAKRNHELLKRLNERR